MNDFKNIKLPLNFKVLLVLLLLSIITGILIGSFLGSLSWSLGVMWPNWMRITLLSASFVSIIVWIFMVNLLFKDLNKNKKMNISHTILFKETPEARVIKVSTITTATDEQLKELSFQIFERCRSLNMPLLEEVFSNRKNADAFKDEMVRLDFFRWKNPDDRKSGLLITKKGFAMLKAYRPANRKE